MALSDAALRNAKSQAKQYKLHDEGGLFVIVRPTGGKLWRLKYRFQGKEQQLTIGTYPAVGLKEAREKRDSAKKLINAGVNPGADKKRKAAAAKIASDNTFGALANEFLEKRERDGIAGTTLSKARWFASLLESGIGKRPVSEIEPVEILTVLKAIEAQGNHETAKRVRAFAARVFRYAIITSRARINPAAELGEALIAPKVRHHPAIIDPKGVGGLLRAIEGYEGHLTTKLALRAAPYLFVRPGELRHAEWEEIDFEAAVWRIPAAKMKMRREHTVPLSRQVLSILKDAEALRGKSPYVFPAVRSWQRPMSENTLNAALRRLGYTTDEMTTHGFRSTASTLLNESGKWSADAIERALAHKDADGVRSAYHRGPHWRERVEMAQWWSDYLDRLRDGGEIISLRGHIEK